MVLPELENEMALLLEDTNLRCYTIGENVTANLDHVCFDNQTPVGVSKMDASSFPSLAFSSVLLPVTRKFIETSHIKGHLKLCQFFL